MNSEHPIDDLFRKELEHREPEFREEFWKDAEKVLDKNPQTSAGKSWWRWFGASAVIVTIAGLAGYYFGANHSIINHSRFQETSRQNISPQKNPSSSPENKRQENSMIDSAWMASDAASTQLQIQIASSGKDSSTRVSRENQNSSFASSVRPHSEKSVSEDKNSTVLKTQYEIQSNESPEKSNAQTESKTKPEAFPDDLVNGENERRGSGEQAGKNILLPQNQNSENALQLNENSSLANSAMNFSFMEHLEFPESKLSFESATPSIINFNPSSVNPQKKNHWSPLKSIEFSLDGGATIVSAPSISSHELGYEWNGLLQYRVNNFVIGAGIGQFSVKEHFSVSSQDIIDSSFTIPVATYDTLLVIDSILIDSNFYHYIYDTTYHITADTSYQQITTHDTVKTKKTYTSTGRYLELPVVFSYRFYGLGLRWQISAGASYGWYSGGLRYALNSEGQVISFKPPPVISILGRVYAQYPFSRKFYLQGYAGLRYVIGLKSDYPVNNYLIYSLGAGLLYQF